METSFYKQWALADELIRQAMAELPEPDTQVLGHLSRNELKLALTGIVEAGRRHSCPSQFWRLLNQTADLIGASDFRDETHCRYREALKVEGDGRDAQRT